MKKIKFKNPIKVWKAWSKKKKIISSVIAVVLVCVLVVNIVFGNRRNSRVMPQITASEATVTVGNISNTIVGTGTLQIDASNSIKIPESITIKEVKVESGDAVSKGDTLAVVDKASVLEAMETIQEEIENLDEKINEGDDVDETTTIKATVSGTIKKIYAEEGDSVVDCIAEKGALIVIAVDGDSDNTIEVVAGSGTVSDISVSKKEEVSKGDTLLTIENDEESTAYKKLIEQRKELAEIFKTLTAMSKSGTIVADMDGIVGSVNVSADSDSSSTSTSGSGISAGQMSTKTSSTSIEASTLTASSTGEKIVKSENTGISLVALASGTSNVSEEETTTAVEETITPQEETTKSVEETTASNEIKTNNKTDNSVINEKQSEKNNKNSNINANVNSNNNVSGNNDANINSNSNVSVSGNSTGKSYSGTISAGSGNSTGKSYSGTISAGSSTVATSNTQTTATDSDDSSYSDQITAFTLASNETMILSVSVDELDINSVAVDQEASVTLDAIEDQTFTGTVTKVSNSSSSSGSGVAKYSVEITIPKDEQMKPGMNASATIVVENKENILILPITAIQEKGDQSFVYISKDSEGNLSGEVAVTTGLSDGDNVEITEGLSEGDTVYYQKTGNTSGSDSGFGGMFGEMSGSGRPEGMGDGSSGGFGGGRGGSGEMPEMPQGMPGGGN